jgi:hypothetical protein
VADINYSINVQISKGNLSNALGASGTASMAQVGLQTQTITVSTSSSSATSISTANLSSVGIAFLRNLSTATASTVQVGISASGTFHPFATLRGGEPAMLRLATGAAYRAIGDATARLRVDVLEG